MTDPTTQDAANTAGQRYLYTSLLSVVVAVLDSEPFQWPLQFLSRDTPTEGFDPVNSSVMM